MDTDSRVDVRFHLSGHLTELLRAASLLKRELQWSSCRPLSDTRSVELKKDEASDPVFISDMEELVIFKDRMLESKLLQPTSPAASIGKSSVRSNRGRSRKRAESKATVEAYESRNTKKPNQK